MNHSIRLSFIFITLLMVITIWHPSHAASSSWSEWVKQLRSEAIDDGVRPKTFDRAFSGITAPNKRVLNFDRNQPEKRLNFYQYRNTRADAYRIKLGKREMRKYQALLQEISANYGVSPCFIVSLWGLETSYGRFMGSFNVIRSLATLAYDDRRAAFFRKQLIYALHILDDGHVTLKDFKGEWAGASGQPQFLPSSWHNYAEDYDGDGRKDIWKTHSDIFASIANYLVQHGWKQDEPWALEVTLPQNFKSNLLGLKQHKTVHEWLALGIRLKEQHPNLTQNLVASVIEPDGGPVMMVFNNFKVIMKWNHSIYYAGTVGYMAEKICKRRL